jgi:hypothetical protein
VAEERMAIEMAAKIVLWVCMAVVPLNDLRELIVENIAFGGFVAQMR